MVKCTINYKETYDIDGILFDKDGTLIKFSSLWLDWAHRLVDSIVSKANLPETDKHVLAESIGFQYNQRIWNPTGPLCIGSPEDLKTICALHLYKQGFPWNEALEIVTDVMQQVNRNEEWKKTIQPVGGLETLLQEATAQSVKLGVVTSDNHEQAVNHLSELGILSYFHSVLGDDQVEQGKPFPEMVYKSCKQLDVQPERVLVIGDSNGDMILGKKGNTMASIGITAEYNDMRVHLKDADHIIENYESITMTEN